MGSTGRDETLVAALLRERAEYVTRGHLDRVAQVDEQLRFRGFDPEREPLTWENAPEPTRIGQSVAWLESGLR